MELVWQKHAWEDYVYWQTTDPAVLKKINELIRDCLRSPFQGIGKPEALKGNLSGCLSRRITAEHRLVYMVREERLHVLQCRYCYT